MPFIQNAYGTGIGKAYAGTIYDMTDLNTHSLSVETGTLRYGSAACLATATGDPERQCIQPNATNLKFRGIVIREHVREQKLVALASPDGNGEFSYLAATETASIATSGRIYVRVVEDVTAGDPVFFIYTLGFGSELLGDFSKSVAPSGADAQAIPGAIFITTATAGNLAVVEIK